MRRLPHILNISTSLLSICFLIIAGLKFTNRDAQSYADEIAWVAVLLFFVSTIVSYVAIRNNVAKNWQISLADWTFIGGVFSLVLSVTTAAIFL
jgi:hypothetical protein